MKHSQALPIDEEMMNRCIALSSDSAQQGEYPYAAVISRKDHFVCDSLNRVARDRDVTRHAEVVALAEAQKILGRTSLDDCTIYVNAEPCAFCCYAIRESRIGKVVFGLRSPLMGGLSPKPVDLLVELLALPPWVEWPLRPTVAAGVQARQPSPHNQTSFRQATCVN
jgi:tRNA(Arg) A34 adenosine deaminase TadA